MDKLETVKNVALRMNHRSFKGEVTFEVPCFDEYLSGVQKTQPPASSMVSHSFSLEWARGMFEIITEVEDPAANDKALLTEVRIKLDNLQRGFWCRQWFWELHSTISIVIDNQELFNFSWNDSGQTIASRCGYRTIESYHGFDVTHCLTSSKANGRASTLKVIVQYQAGHFEQGAPEYNKKLEYPGRICGKPELLEALHRGAESDFIISCQGQEYPVHRIVLKWASPVFRRMIETPMAEASSSKLVITDVDSSVVRMMIDFIYKGRTNVVLDNEVVSLLYCAEKYELVALKEHCVKYMMTILSETNVTEFLSSAIRCNADEAVKELVDWCKERFWELSQKDEFRAYVEANSEVFYGGK